VELAPGVTRGQIEGATGAAVSFAGVQPRA
jgi:acyl CoA:acetate/3-ketoacid CoA transferase beta subunit